MASETLVAAFLKVTCSTDREVACIYLEHDGGNLDQAILRYMADRAANENETTCASGPTPPATPTRSTSLRTSHGRRFSIYIAITGETIRTPTFSGIATTFDNFIQWLQRQPQVLQVLDIVQKPLTDFSLYCEKEERFYYNSNKKEWVQKKNISRHAPARLRKNTLLKKWENNTSFTLLYGYGVKVSNPMKKLELTVPFDNYFTVGHLKTTLRQHYPGLVPANDFFILTFNGDQQTIGQRRICDMFPIGENIPFHIFEYAVMVQALDGASYQIAFSSDFTVQAFQKRIAQKGPFGSDIPLDRQCFVLDGKILDITKTALLKDVGIELPVGSTFVVLDLTNPQIENTTAQRQGQIGEETNGNDFFEDEGETTEAKCRCCCCRRLWGDVWRYSTVPRQDHCRNPELIEMNVVRTEEDIPNANTLTSSGPGCIIPQAELRSLSLRQLKDLALQILLRCDEEQWTSTNPKKKQCRLKPSEVTLYDLVTQYIRPLTKDRQCSYVELVARGSRSPQWFVSHFWGDPVLELIACLERHAKDRYVSEPDNVTYWICAFSNNQWNIAEELKDDPMDSSFFMAMQQTDGVVSVVGPTMACYGRIWCGFEVAMALRDMAKERETDGSRYLYDVYTAHGSPDAPGYKPRMCVGLTDGPAAIDINATTKTTSSTVNQENRQVPFPSKRIGLQVRIEHAQASREEDRRKILGYICRSEAHIDPPPSHESYDEVNALLAGKFAVSTFPQALYRGLSEENLSLYLKAISHYPQLQRLSMNFAFQPGVLLLRDVWGERYVGKHGFRRHAAAFMDALPNHLKELRLNYKPFAFQTTDEFAIGLRNLVNLEKFELRVPSCLRDMDCIAHELQWLIKLQELTLSFEGCNNIQNLNSLFETMSSLSNIRELTLELEGCKSLQYSASSHQWARNARVERLSLSMGGCQNDFIEAMCQMVCNLKNLSFLDLDLSGWRTNSVARLKTMEVLSGLKNLQSLEISFGCCELDTAEHLFSLLGCLTQLTSLCISVIGNRSLDLTIAKLPFAKLTQLVNLEIEASGCDISSVSFLAGIGSLRELRVLALNVAGNKRVSSLTTLANAVARLSLLEELRLDACNCSLSALSIRRFLYPVLSSLSKNCKLDLKFNGAKVVFPELQDLKGEAGVLKQKLEKRRDAIARTS